MLDATDQQILAALSQNARITMKELGERVHLTGQAAAARIAKLEDKGVIEKYTIQINQARLGYPVHALITIYNYSLLHQPYLDFINSQTHYVQHNYKISGNGCYLLECRFPATADLDHFLSMLSKHTNYSVNLVLSDTL